MITNDYKIEKKEAPQFEPLPEDKYNVELLDIEERDDTGQFSEPGDKIYLFTFVVLNGEDKDGKSLRGRRIWSSFVPTFFFTSTKSKKWPGKNELYRIVEALAKTEMTDEKVAKFRSIHLNKLIGMQCVVFTKNTFTIPYQIYKSIKYFFFLFVIDLLIFIK